MDDTKNLEQSVQPAVPTSTLARYDNSIFDDFSDEERLLNFVTPFTKGDASRFKKPSDVALVLIAAKELDIPFSTAISKAYIIPGTNVIAYDSHIQRGLAQRANILSETIEDYQPLYRYYINKDESIDEDELQNNSELYKVFTTATILKKWLSDNPNAKELAVLRNAKPYDYRTKIKFTRFFRLPGGKYKTLVEYGTYLYTEAVEAGLAGGNRDNWNKYKRDMMYARATGRGLRRIADDVINGMYAKEEFGIFSDSDYIEYEETN